MSALVTARVARIRSQTDPPRKYQGIRRRSAALADGCAPAVPLCGD